LAGGAAVSTPQIEKSFHRLFFGLNQNEGAWGLDFFLFEAGNIETVYRRLGLIVQLTAHERKPTGF
jgi:hypothetical protein